MSYDEKGTWAYLVASTVAYLVYLAIVGDRLAHTSVAQVSYVAVLLWTGAASALVSTVVRTLIETASPSDSRKSDVRDKEIYRHGEYVSRWFIVAGAGGALIMAMVRLDYFWIANVIYLGFVLWAVVGSAVKLVAYRQGL